MDIDKMKKAVREADERVRAMNASMAESVRDAVVGGKKTALDNIAGRYKRLSILSFVMSAVMSLEFQSPVFPAEYRLSLSVCFGIDMLLCGLMDLWLYHLVKRIDLLMSVEQVATDALLCRKRHLQFISVFMPISILLVGFMCYVLLSDKFAVIGVIVGAIVGILLGGRLLRRFLRDYKLLTLD